VYYVATDMKWVGFKASLTTFHATLLNTRLASTSLTPSVKRKCSYMQKRIKFVCQSKKQLKFETYLLNLPKTSLLWHHERSHGQRTTWASSGSTNVQPLIDRSHEPCRGTTIDKRHPAPCWHNYGVIGRSSWRLPSTAHQMNGSPSYPPSSEQVEPGESVATYKNWISYFIQKWI
jgi:hypothetical protein